MGIVVGTAWHFVYAWTGRNALVGLVAPVNESVWEHTKLLVVPLLAWTAVEAFVLSDGRRLAFAKAASLPAGALFIVVFFYTYTGALGIESVAVDIASFVVAVLGTQWLSFRLLSRRRDAPLPTIASVTLLCAFALAYVPLTLAPPHVPLFRDGPSGGYGTSVGESSARTDSGH